ncbi:hypothetical protein Daesc_003669 [Daldinia eschscholtzii]|uniref:Uncharacterized protein n=1 Tax=Daldinia eschscholtzii TaxID=292717 RepID=A0AAX6MV18_9PEZI
MESQKAKYATLGRVDDSDDSRSSTEVDDSLMGNEKEWHDVELGTPTTRAGRIRKFVTDFKSARWLIDTVRDQWRRPVAEEKEVNPWQFGQDLTGVGPRCKFDSAFSHVVITVKSDKALVTQRITTFQRDESYAPNNTAEFFTDEVLQRWNDLMPSKGSREFSMVKTMY